jgi:hypothetical protein
VKKWGLLIPFGNHLDLHVSFVSARCGKKLKEVLFSRGMRRIPTFEVFLFWSAIPTSLKAAFASKLLYTLRGGKKHGVFIEMDLEFHTHFQYNYQVTLLAFPFPVVAHKMNCKELKPLNGNDLKFRTFRTRFKICLIVLRFRTCFRCKVLWRQRRWKIRSRISGGGAIKTIQISVAWVREQLYRPSDCRLSEKLVPTFADRGCQVISVTDPYGRIPAFLDWSSHVFFQVAPQLYSRSRVNPVPDPLLLRKSGSARNRTRTYANVARNSDHKTTEAVYFLIHKKSKAIPVTGRQGL